MFDLTVVIIDVIVSIILIILGNAFINYCAKLYNLKLTLFKLENISKEEQLNNLIKEKRNLN